MSTLSEMNFLVPIIYLTALWFTAVHTRAFTHDEYKEHLGSKGPYIPPKNLSLPDAHGCEPVMIVGLARHGSRNPGKSDIKSYKKIKSIFSDPSVKYKPSFEWLRYWESAYDITAAHDLVNAGLEEHFGIGERFRMRFPSLFDTYSFRTHRFQSSHLERAARFDHCSQNSSYFSELTRLPTANLIFCRQSHFLSPRQQCALCAMPARSHRAASQCTCARVTVPSCRRHTMPLAP
jgi:hypothetical protein